MNACKIALGLMMLTLLSIITSQPIAAQANYQFTQIDVPGSYGTDVYGISNNGLVSGFYLDAAGFDHGFVWKEGTFTDVDHPGSLDTLLGPANTRGVIIGNFDNTIVGSAALYDVRSGTWTTLPDIPGTVFNVGNGINNAGATTGSAFDSTYSNGIGWVWDGSAYSFFSVPGASGFGTYASGINDRGQIAGFYSDSSGVRHGFLKEGAAITIIDVPGARDTLFYSINNQGDMVGYYGNRTVPVRHGLLLRRGRVITVDYPGATNTWIYYANDRDELAGVYLDNSGIFHGFIATPVR